MPTKVDTHLSRLRLAGYREETIRTKRRVFSLLAHHIDPTTIDAASRFDLEDFLARPGLKATTRKAYRSHLRAYYRWLVEEGLRDDDPTYRIAPIKIPKALPRPIGDGDLASALSAANPRMRAWLLLMCLAGLRCCEVARLRPQDVQETASGVVLFLREAKGGGQATVPAHQAVLAQLSELPIRQGLWWDVSPGWVSIETNRFLRAQGIPSTAYGLRHWAGTAWYNVDRDILATQRLLRHASVVNTQLYADIDPVRPAEVAARVTVPRRALPSAS